MYEPLGRAEPRSSAVAGRGSVGGAGGVATARRGGSVTRSCFHETYSGSGCVTCSRRLWAGRCGLRCVCGHRGWFRSLVAGARSYSGARGRTRGGRGRTRGRAVVPGGARSYPRASLRYDLARKGTTARRTVRPRAKGYDRAGLSPRSSTGRPARLRERVDGPNQNPANQPSRCLD